MERSSRQWMRRAGRDGRAAMVMLLIAAAPAVSAAGQEASSQPAEPYVEAASTQAIPKVQLMARTTGEQPGEEKKAKEESGKEKAPDKEKAPRMVLQLDLMGNFRLVPETPGC